MVLHRKRLHWSCAYVFHLACPAGTWGTNCTNVCECTKHGKCQPDDGSCLCESGWTGPLCHHRTRPIRSALLPCTCARANRQALFSNFALVPHSCVRRRGRPGRCRPGRGGRVRSRRRCDSTHSRSAHACALAQRTRVTRSASRAGSSCICRHAAEPTAPMQPQERRALPTAICARPTSAVPLAPACMSPTTAHAATALLGPTR